MLVVGLLLQPKTEDELGENGESETENRGVFQSTKKQRTPFHAIFLFFLSVLSAGYKPNVKTRGGIAFTQNIKLKTKLYMSATRTLCYQPYEITSNHTWTTEREMASEEEKRNMSGAYPMKGGDGLYIYSNNSTFQICLSSFMCYSFDLIMATTALLKPSTT